MKTRQAVSLISCCVVAAGLVISACARQQPPLDGSDIAGAYTLVSVNGNPVPTSVDHQGAALQVRSGTLTLGADGTCSTRTVFVPPSGTEVRREVGATYTRDGSRLTLRWKGAGKTTGTIADGTFTMDNEGMVFVYRK